MALDPLVGEIRQKVQKRNVRAVIVQWIGGRDSAKQ